MPGVAGAIKQVGADIGEAVVKPVIDEVGKAIEEGAQSVIGTPVQKPIDPVEQKKKQEEDLKKKQWAMNVINWNKQLDMAQGKVRQEEKQKEQGKKQEEDESKKVKQYEILQQQKKSQQMTTLQKESRKTEIKGGVGG